MIGDGDPMGVAAQVAEHVPGTPKGTFDVDDPFAGMHLATEPTEVFRFTQVSNRSGQFDRTVGDGATESIQKLATEDSGEHLLGQEEAWRAWNPTGLIRSQSASRYDTMDVGMELQVLTPGMQDAEETDPYAESLGIGGNFHQRIGHAAKQQGIECGRVLEEEWVELVGDGEHDVEVGCGQEFGFPGLEPTSSGLGLTLWTMAVATGVERDSGFAPTLGTPVDVTAHRSGTTVHDRAQDFVFLNTEAVMSEETANPNAKDVGHLHGGSVHSPFGFLKRGDGPRSGTDRESTGFTTPCMCAWDRCR